MNAHAYPRPLVALLTDFGDRDGYVGTMKGVILSHCPDAQLVDIANHVPPQDVDAAAFVLLNSIRNFPPHTVFLCVVDPGVGTGRAILAARFPCGRRAVAPDNGLLRYVVAAAEGTRVVTVDPARVADDASATFHGRDIMAPLAARLAAGEACDTFGAERDAQSVAQPLIPPGRPLTGRQPARIVYADRFGTLFLDVTHAANITAVCAGNVTVDTVVATYAEAPDSAPVLLRGSSGLWEIAVRNGSAADALELGINDSIEVTIGD